MYPQLPYREWQVSLVREQLSPTPTPTPAAPSTGHHPEQSGWAAGVDEHGDVEAICRAMEPTGFDEKTLIRIFTSPKYASLWAMRQLVERYRQHLRRDLAKDIESWTDGYLKMTLSAMIEGPLERDVRVLIEALDGAVTDEEALNGVLLCRSNADIRAIADEYRRIRGHDLLVDIDIDKDDEDDDTFYSMVLSAQRVDEQATVKPADIDRMTSELRRLIENNVRHPDVTVAVARILTSANDAEIRAMIDSYRQKYDNASLEEAIVGAFLGSVLYDGFFHIFLHARDRAHLDARRLAQPLRKTVRDDRLFINRVVSLYWDPPRLEAAKAAYQRVFNTGSSFGTAVKTLLTGGYGDLMLTLLREK
ncbi:Annexin [Xylariomycetidae sp. FL2044]|nr:Annexin [Xylariomycetidae sp. FL2044]